MELRSKGWLISKNKEGKRSNIWKLIVHSHMTARDHRGEIPTTLVVNLSISILIDPIIVDSKGLTASLEIRISI
jgi:hypothetical protein